MQYESIVSYLHSERICLCIHICIYIYIYMCVICHRVTIVIVLASMSDYVCMHAHMLYIVCYNVGIV